MNANRYATVSVWFHWISAALILGQIWLGFTFHDLPRGSPERAYYFDAHKTVGVIILLVVIARIVHRFIVPPPALPKGTPGWERTLAGVSHFALYAFMVVLPVTGLMHVYKRAEEGMVSLMWGLKFPAIPGEEALGLDLGEGHELLAKLLIALLVVHVLAAIYHQLRRDRAAGRMWPFR